MLLDNAPPDLTPAQIETVKILRECISKPIFTALDAAQVLGRRKASTAATLCNLVAKGVLHRESIGYFTFDPAAVKVRALNSHARRVLKDIQDNPDPEPEIILGPITDAETAFRWMKGHKVDIVRFGDLYMLDGRIRITEEQLIASAERRRTSKREWSPIRFAVETSIPDPTPAQRMGAR